jgi:putative ABC transport system ATP-binding protein
VAFRFTKEPCRPARAGTALAWPISGPPAAPTEAVREELSGQGRAMQPLVELRNLTKTYHTFVEGTQALRGIDFTVEPGEFVAITGPSGSGKSTLMHIIGLLDTPTGGTYRLNGLDVSRISGNRQAELRSREIGFVFQQSNLLPRATVLENVLLPTVYRQVSQPVQRARQIIEELGLADRVRHKGNQLSGGQMQRVAIARALVMEPSLLLADEPTGNLDSAMSAEIVELFKTINRRGTTVVLITHERDVAQEARRIIELRDGRIAGERRGAEA